MCSAVNITYSVLCIAYFMGAACDIHMPIFQKTYIIHKLIIKFLENIWLAIFIVHSKNDGLIPNYKTNMMCVQ